jgi:hypothetical protein
MTRARSVTLTFPSLRPDTLNIWHSPDCCIPPAKFSFNVKAMGLAVPARRLWGHAPRVRSRPRVRRAIASLSDAHQ